MGTERPGWILNWLSGRISLNFTRSLRAWYVLLFKTYFWSARSISAPTWHILCLTKKDSYNCSSFKSHRSLHAARLNALRWAPCSSERERRAGWEKAPQRTCFTVGHTQSECVESQFLLQGRSPSLSFWLRTLTSVAICGGLVCIQHKHRHFKKTEVNNLFSPAAGRLQHLPKPAATQTQHKSKLVMLQLTGLCLTTLPSPARFEGTRLPVAVSPVCFKTIRRSLVPE